MKTNIVQNICTTFILFGWYLSLKDTFILHETRRQLFHIPLFRAAQTKKRWKKVMHQLWRLLCNSLESGTF